MRVCVAQPAARGHRWWGIWAKAALAVGLDGQPNQARPTNATWNGATIAQSDNTVAVKGNH